MKKILTLLLTGCSFSAFALQGGPDLWGYKWYDNTDTAVVAPVYNWIDITAFETSTEVKLLGDDNTRGPFVMNFDFHYYWYDVNQFWVGSNGYIIFEDGQLASPFPTNKSPNAPNNFIGALMNDLTFLGAGNPGKCWYWISLDQDTLIVSWLDVPFFDTSIEGYTDSTNTFQIILSAIDSSITFQYENIQPSSPFSGISYAGIENISGSVGLWWSNSPPGQAFLSPYDNYAVKYVYPDEDTAQIVDPGVAYNDNPRTGGIFLVQDNDPVALTSLIQNFGTSTVNPVEVNMRVKNPNNNEIINNTQFTDTLESMETQLLTSPNSLIPDTSGTYTYIVSSSYTGDKVNPNNKKELEIVVVDTTQQEIWLGYDDGQVTALSGVNWVGDDGGAGMHFIPPFYPVAITKIHYFITSNFNNVAFSAKLLDDDGVSGLPFTIFDSIYVTSADMVINGWTDLILDAPVIVNSGGFYGSWNMEGEGITLGSTTKTISNRSYEVFDYGWGIYRFGSTQDPMIAVTVEKYSFPTGVTPVEDAVNLQIFPNPASGHVNLVYNLPKYQGDNILFIHDMQGKELKSFDLNHQSGTHHLTLDVSMLPAGVYFASVISGKEKAIQKLVVTE